MATLFNLGGCSAAKMNGITSLDRVVRSVGRKTQQQLHHPLDHVRVECGHLQPTAVTSAHDKSQVFVNLIEAGGYRIGGKQSGVYWDTAGSTHACLAWWRGCKDDDSHMRGNGRNRQDFRKESGLANLIEVHGAFFLIFLCNCSGILRYRLSGCVSNVKND